MGISGYRLFVLLFAAGCLAFTAGCLPGTTSETDQSGSTDLAGDSTADLQREETADGQIDTSTGIDLIDVSPGSDTADSQVGEDAGDSQDGTDSTDQSGALDSDATDQQHEPDVLEDMPDELDAETDLLDDQPIGDSEPGDADDEDTAPIDWQWAELPDPHQLDSYDAGSNSDIGSDSDAEPPQLKCPGQLGEMLSRGDYCIDRFELQTLPSGSKPKVNVTPTDTVTPKNARTLCEKEGKRLCTLQELSRECSRGGTTLYPTGNDFDLDACRMPNQSTVGKTGIPLCGGQYGAANLVGNLWEIAAFDDNDEWVWLFGGDYNGTQSYQYSCCIRTEPGVGVPSACSTHYDQSKPFNGANVTLLKLNSLDFTKDVFGRPVKFGFRCCWDASMK